MKKLALIMLLGLMAAGCGKEETAAGGEKQPTEAAQEAATEVTKTPEESMPTPPVEDVTEDADTAEDDAAADEEDDAGAAGETVLENEYFRASLKSFEIDEEKDSVTAVFEFENITDRTYYKNDEEILPGASWEKTVMYPTEKWEKEVGRTSWIHYDLYELYDGEQEPFFSGRLSFSVAEDLTVTDMELFTE